MSGANLRSEYRRRGWFPIPLSPGEKSPYAEDWPTKNFVEEDFAEDDNTGLRLEGGIVDVDLDCVEALAVAGAFLPPTAVFGRESTPRSHWIYNCPELQNPVVFKDNHKKVILELRTGQNLETMVEPSIHPSDEAVKWEKPFDSTTTVAEVSSGTLQRRAALVAASALIARNYAVEGSRHDWTLNLAGCLRQLGALHEEATEMIRAASVFAGDKKFSDRKLEVDTTFRRDDDSPTTGFTKLRQDDKHLAEGLKKILGGKLKRGGFIVNNSGAIVANLAENIRRAFVKEGVVLRWNSFREQKVLEQDGWMEVVDDILAKTLWITLQDKYGFLPPREFFFSVLDVEAAQSPYHPVRDWLTELKWDGVPRLDKWLITYAGAEDTEYVREVGKLPLIAAVKRVFNPGEKFDELLVLESPQGWQKSTAIKTLVPNLDWYSEDLPLGADSKIVIERSRGIWIYEIAEMHGHSKKETAKIKTFLSREVDTARKAYGHESTSVKRQWIAIGTINQGTYLHDSTGNRRFWPVRVQHFDIEALERDRDQIWAEAVSRRHESVRMKQSLWEAAAEEQESRREVDPWEIEIKEALELNDEFKLRGHNGLPLSDGDGNPEGWRCNDRMLFEILGLSVKERDRQAQGRINAVMEKLKFRKVKSFRDPMSKRISLGWRKDGN